MKIGRIYNISASYEEFIEGIRPNLDSENELTYSLEKGVFKSLHRATINHIDPSMNHLLLKMRSKKVTLHIVKKVRCSKIFIYPMNTA